MDRIDLDYGYMDSRFGKYISKRLVKLNEEIFELNKVFTDLCLDEDEKKRMFIDELSDVNAVVAHLAHLHGVTQDELRDMAARKIKARALDDNSARTHKHLKRKKPTQIV